MARLSSRPAFLNLMRIQMPVGALTSIDHRPTGVLLAAGVPFSLYFLYLSLHREQTFAAMMVWLSYRLFRCRTIMNCSEVCPKGLEPSHAIETIRLKMLKIETPGGLPFHTSIGFKKGE